MLPYDSEHRLLTEPRSPFFMLYYVVCYSHIRPLLALSCLLLTSPPPKARAGADRRRRWARAPGRRGRRRRAGRCSCWAGAAGSARSPDRLAPPHHTRWLPGLPMVSGGHGGFCLAAILGHWVLILGELSCFISSMNAYLLGYS